MSGAGRGEARTRTAGLILAGGRARRMGGRPKAFIRVGGKTLLSRAIGRLRPQTDALAISANGETERMAAFGLPVIADTLPDFPGPLAGVLAGMLWARRAAPEARWLVTVAVDTPFFPTDLVARLLAAARREDAEIACAMSRGRLHPVFGLWPVEIAEDLERALTREGLREAGRFAARRRLARVDFGEGLPDPFFNINEPGDIPAAERLAASGEAK